MESLVVECFENKNSDRHGIQYNMKSAQQNGYAPRVNYIRANPENETDPRW